MKDDDKPKEGSFLFLFCKIVAIGFSCFVSTPAFSSFFPDTFYGERVFILWLALWILGISAEMFRSLSKSNSIIQKFHKKKDKCTELKKEVKELEEQHKVLNEKHEKLSEKHRALSEQFTEKNRMLKHIADSLPIMRLGGDLAVIQKEEAERIKYFKTVKEELRRWENEISE